MKDATQSAPDGFVAIAHWPRYDLLGPSSFSQLSETEGDLRWDNERRSSLAAVQSRPMRVQAWRLAQTQIQRVVENPQARHMLVVHPLQEA